MKARLALILTLGLLCCLVFSAGSALAWPPCPPGYHWSPNFNECRPNRGPCPPGTHWNGRVGQCVANRPACPPGYHWNGNVGQCVENRPVCPPGFHWSNRFRECRPNGAPPPAIVIPLPR